MYMHRVHQHSQHDLHSREYHQGLRAPRPCQRDGGQAEGDERRHGNEEGIPRGLLQLLPWEEGAAAEEVAEDGVEGEEVGEEAEDAVGDGVDFDVGLEGMVSRWRRQCDGNKATAQTKSWASLVFESILFGPAKGVLAIEAILGFLHINRARRGAEPAPQPA
ncbi:hypothetical protein BDW02DRAFT_33757 [Decorospora gaudefroyi]|uniref:Uncharacterized protein n=1 Tax=Decorospora gaudefroyi TaxID=184978 RepID=A0A6A5KQE1_9PLEO|nr:hypothetical protein BDW02DRAFT_33757 [Decorospora gaudefroyi]